MQGVCQREDGGCGQAGRGCRPSGAVSAQEPGWGCCGGRARPPDLALGMATCSHTRLPRRQERGRWVAWRRGRKRGQRRPRPAPACLLLPVSRLGSCLRPGQVCAAAEGRCLQWPRRVSFWRPRVPGACWTSARSWLSRPAKPFCPGLLPPRHSPWWSPRATRSAPSSL